MKEPNFKFSIEENLTNRKPLLILGKPSTSKSLLCKLIERTFKKEEVVFLDGRDTHLFESPFALSSATKDTKLIIIDDFNLSPELLFYFLLNYYDEGKGLLVNKRGEEIFYINPAIIINSDMRLEEFNDLGFSAKRRFNAIEL